MSKLLHVLFYIKRNSTTLWKEDHFHQCFQNKQKNSKDNRENKKKISKAICSRLKYKIVFWSKKDWKINKDDKKCKNNRKEEYKEINNWKPYLKNIVKNSKNLRNKNRKKRISKRKGYKNKKERDRSMKKI